MGKHSLKISLSSMLLLAAAGSMPALAHIDQSELAQFYQDNPKIKQNMEKLKKELKKSQEDPAAEPKLKGEDVLLTAEDKKRAAALAGESAKSFMAEIIEEYKEEKSRIIEENIRASAEALATPETRALYRQYLRTVVKIWAQNGADQNYHVNWIITRLMKPDGWVGQFPTLAINVPKLKEMGAAGLFTSPNQIELIGLDIVVLSHEFYHHTDNANGLDGQSWAGDWTPAGAKTPPWEKLAYTEMGRELMEGGASGRQAPSLAGGPVRDVQPESEDLGGARARALNETGIEMMSRLRDDQSPPARHRQRDRRPSSRRDLQKPDPSTNQGAIYEDYYSLVLHFWDGITDIEGPQNRVPGMDLFLSNVEERARPGIDVPLTEIALNADNARETFRLSYNDLARVGDKPHLSTIREQYQKFIEELDLIQDELARSLDILDDQAASAQATVGVMVLEPPDSPGARLRLAPLGGIASLAPALELMRERMDGLANRIKTAKGLLKRAAKRAQLAQDLAKRAGELDKGSVAKVGMGRTQGKQRDYRAGMTSARVIHDSGERMAAAVKKGDEVIEMMEGQLDPMQEGLRKAIDTLYKADGKVALAKQIQIQSGQRINWNHTMRMNDAIKYGYEAALDREWWVGRSRMAVGEAEVDSTKMRDAYQSATALAYRAEATIGQIRARITEIDVALGDAQHFPKPLAKRPLDIPAVEDPYGRNKDRPPAKQVQSKALAASRTLKSSNDRISGSFDGVSQEENIEGHGPVSY